MNIVKAIARWTGAVVLILVGVTFFFVGLLLCCTIIGIPIGALMAFGSLGVIAGGLALTSPEMAAAVRARQSALRGRLARQPVV